MSSDDPRVWAPLWLELSGLPQEVAKKTKASAGWPLLKKIVELDCEKNALPGTVEISLADLHLRTGVAPEAARKASESLRKMKLIACFLPDNDEEPALFRIHVPLPTPQTYEQVRETYPQVIPAASGPGRYSCTFEESDTAEHEPVKKDLQETVDLYFDTVGLKMNAFILDELRILVDLFSMDDIRRTFRRARKNEIRSLRWIMQELTRKGQPNPSDVNSNGPTRISEGEG